MAIEKVNLATPGGDTARSAFTKINANFTGPAHAASRLVGTSSGDVVELTANGMAGLGYGSTNLPRVEGDLNTHSDKTWLFRGTDLENAPTTGWYYYDTQVHGSGNVVQFAHHLTDTSSYVRRQAGGVWRTWYPLNTSKAAYDTTTASGANVYLAGDGTLRRSTSSERYKNILSPLTLDDAKYNLAMQLEPIVYRSTADADNPDYHYYSFSAEALGAYDPAFTLWRDTETVTDADGNVIEQPLAERVAEGINLNAIVAFLHATNIKQGKIIADLERRLSVLEATPEV